MSATQESSTSTAAPTASHELVARLFDDFRNEFAALSICKVQLMGAARGRARAAAVDACVEAVVSVLFTPRYLPCLLTFFFF